MKVPPVKPLLIRDLGVRLVDWRDAPVEDLKAARELLWQVILGRVLRTQRPQTSLCAPEDGHNDPRLGHINFVVYEGREVRGLFGLYNMRIERSAPLKDEYSAMPMPGVQEIAGLGLGQSWAAIMRHFLAKDLEFQSGRVLDLVQWDFPEGKDRRWTLDDFSAPIIAAIQGDGDLKETVTDSDGSYPKRVRRKGTFGADAEPLR